MNDETKGIYEKYYTEFYDVGSINDQFKKLKEQFVL